MRSLEKCFSPHFSFAGRFDEHFYTSLCRIEVAFRLIFQRGIPGWTYCGIFIPVHHRIRHLHLRTQSRHRAYRQSLETGCKDPVLFIFSRSINIVDAQCIALTAGDQLQGMSRTIQFPIEFHTVKPAETDFLILKVKDIPDGIVFLFFRNRITGLESSELPGAAMHVRKQIIAAWHLKSESGDLLTAGNGDIQTDYTVKIDLRNSFVMYLFPAAFPLKFHAGVIFSDCRDQLPGTWSR